MAISNINNRVRISGLSSGFDTESLVRDMMRIEQYKYDKQWKVKAKLEFRQEALAKIQNTVRDFRNDFFSQAGKNASMISRLTFMSFTTVTDDKNDAVSVKATEATNGNVVISQIIALAKGATAASSAPVSLIDENPTLGTKAKVGIKLTDKLSDLTLDNALKFDESGANNEIKKINFAINGIQFTFDKNDTLQTVINTVNSSAANVTMSFSAVTDKLTVTSKNTGDSARMMLFDLGDSSFFETFNIRGGIYGGTDAEMMLNGVDVAATSAQTQTFSTIASGTVDSSDRLDSLGLTTALDFSSGPVTFKINGQTFTIDASDSLDDVMADVNANTAAGVTMSFKDNKLIIKSNTVGYDSVIDLDNDTSNFFSAFKVSTGQTRGMDAHVEGDLVRSATNNFTLDGIEYTLKKTTNTPITISATLNVDGIVDSIKSFVDAYNKMVVGFKEKLSEKVYRNYQPLTSDERGALKDSEAAMYDDLVKSGLMRNDSELSQLLSDMRSLLFEKVGGTGKMMVNIGLSTVKYAKGMDAYSGTIEIDESVLRAAIEQDPNGVAEMFTKTSTATDPKEKADATGYAQKMYELMNTYTNNTVWNTNLQFAQTLNKMEKSLDALQKKLYAKEEALYAKFTAMEKALSKLNSQSDWISSQLSSLSS